MNTKDIMEKLQAPFEYNEIEWLVKIANEKNETGLALPYVTARAIQNRLDDVCGIDGWQNTFIEWKDKSQLCGISIKFGEEWITKWDGADDTNTDGTKGGLSGAMKRAATAWGIGRYLYNLPAIWTPITIEVNKNGKKNYKIKKKPSLPDWALPKKVNKPSATWNIEENLLPEIPEHIKACINSFAKLKISQEDIENYLCKEAFLISDEELEQLREIYLKIVNKKAKKETYFSEKYVLDVTTQKNKSLEDKLEEVLV